MWDKNKEINKNWQTDREYRGLLTTASRHANASKPTARCSYYLFISNIASRYSILTAPRTDTAIRLSTRENVSGVSGFDRFVCLFISREPVIHHRSSLRSVARARTLTWPRTRALRAHVDVQVDSFAGFFIFLLEFLLDSGESLLQRRHLENFSSTIERRGHLLPSSGHWGKTATRTAL